MSDIEAAEFESWVERFEQLQAAGPADLRSFLNSLPAESPVPRRELLLECIAIDLERGWQRNPQRGPLWEDYVQVLPELNPLEQLPAQVLAEEYRARQRWGDRPGHSSWLARFSARGPDLAAIVAAIDAQLAAEDADDESSLDGESWLDTLSAEAVPLAQIGFGELLLERRIGAGGMGKVYRASWRGHEEPVAVKFLRKSLLRNPAAVRRLLAEAQLVASLSHPHLLRIHGVGQTPGAGWFIVMDLAAAGDLSGRRFAGDEELTQLLGWLGDAADALDTAHQAGVIHCDLKPSNLLIGEGDHVYVADFGLARSAGESQQGLRWEGTLGYMAPEQFDASLGAVSVLTDVYGLGAVLYSLLCGHPPNSGKDAAEAAGLAGHDSCRHRDDSAGLRLGDCSPLAGRNTDSAVSHGGRDAQRTRRGSYGVADGFLSAASTSFAGSAYHQASSPTLMPCISVLPSKSVPAPTLKSLTVG